MMSYGQNSHDAEFHVVPSLVPLKIAFQEAVIPVCSEEEGAWEITKMF